MIDTALALLILTLTAILALCFHDLREARRKKRRVVRFALTRIRLQSKPERRKNMLSIRLSIAQVAVLAFSPVDAEGKPAQLDGKPVVTPIEGDATVRTIGDEIFLIPGETPGKAKFKVAGDGEQGEGVTILEEEIELDMTPVNAVSLGLGYSLRSKSSLPAE